MKPILLKMQAFGSFVEEEIDFSVLPDDLYLIAGDTGSGKTTIFDAIMFALYGTASGTNRKPKMLHSDYALGDKYRHTRVELTFSQNDKVYTVTRELRYKKTQRMGETDEAPTPDAEFRDAEGAETPLKGVDKVNARMIALTGMGAEQFRKIAMLAQGEFRAFLADSKDRSDILSRLFDDSLYRRFEDILEGARKKLLAVRGDWLKSIEVAVNPQNLNLPEDMTEEQRAKFLKDSPDLTEELQKLIGSEQADEERLQGELRKNETLRGSLALRLQEAERINKAIGRADEARGRKAELEAREPEMEALQLRTDAAERALNTVSPAEKALRTRRQEQAKAQLLLDTAKKKTKDCAERAATAAAALEEAKKREPEAQRLRAEEEAVRRDLPRYAERAKAESDLASGLEAQKRAAGKAEQAQASLAETQEKLQKIAGALPEYEGAEDQAFAEINRKLAAEDREKRFRELSGSRELVIRAKVLHEQQNERLASCIKDENEKREKKEKAEKNFIWGQVGVIADKMRGMIAEKGVVRCPVCNTLHYAKDGHEFAERRPDTPTEAEVEAARQLYEDAHKRTSEEDRNAAKLRESLNGRTENLMKAAQALGLTEDAEALLEIGFIETKTAEASLAALQAKAAAEAAEARVKEKKRLQKEEKDLRISEQRQLTELQAAQEENSRAAGQVRAAQGRLEGMGTLPYESEEAAKRAQLRFAMGASAIEEAVRKAQSDEKDAAEAYSTAQGAESSAEAELGRSGEYLRTAEDGYREALLKAGMDEAAYRAALPEDERQPAAWKEKLRKFADDTAKAEGELKAAEAAVRDHPERVDTQEDEAALDAAEAERTALEERKKREAARLTTHENALSAVRNAKKELAASDAAYLRLDRLARLACNSDASARDAKTSFHRYIQNFVFREIVEEANRHLSRMTGGKYLLQDRDKARNGHSNSGLLLDVLDTTTGKRRDTDSLSGGEGFQASLALALGLSGVVQRHSGVCRVDSMFIDEGFGTLSEAELESAVCTLRDIARGGRQIGIISHVKSLEESIDSRILVRRGPHGSTAEVQV